MNGSGSAGIMASYNGFARHDSASAICTLTGGATGATDTARAYVMRAGSLRTSLACPSGKYLQQFWHVYESRLPQQRLFVSPL